MYLPKQSKELHPCIVMMLHEQQFDQMFTDASLPGSVINLAAELSKPLFILSKNK